MVGLLYNFHSTMLLILDHLHGKPKVCVKLAKVVIVNMGSVTVNVNGYNAKNDNDLADTLVRRINEMLDEDSSVWK